MENGSDVFFFNLLLFAVRNTPPLGQITLKLQMIAHRIHIDIIYSSKGIPADGLPFLFDCIGATDPDDPIPDFSTGISLLVAQGLIQLHMGSLSISSRIPAETACWIELPMTTGIDAVVAPYIFRLIPLIITLLTQK